jgi:hypothetical protein
MTECIEVDKYYVNYFSKHPLASASIQFMDGAGQMRGAMWFYDNPKELPNDELMQDEDGMTYVFSYSSMDHFKNVLEIVRKEKVCLKGSKDFVWLETM